MQTRSGRAARAKAAPPSIVIQPDPIQPNPEETSTPAAPGPVVPSAPLDRDENGNAIDWSRPDTLRQRSGLWVAAWFLVPLIAILVWGYLTR